MTSYDLIWILVEQLLKDKDAKSKEKAQEDQGQYRKNVAQLHSCFFIEIKKELGARNPPNSIINQTSMINLN